MQSLELDNMIPLIIDLMKPFLFDVKDILESHQVFTNCSFSDKKKDIPETRIRISSHVRCLTAICKGIQHTSGDVDVEPISTLQSELFLKKLPEHLQHQLSSVTHGIWQLISQIMHQYPYDVQVLEVSLFLR